METAESIDETKAELSDLLEVVRALSEYNGFSLSQIIEEADKKAKERGSFSDRIFLLEVE